MKRLKALVSCVIAAACVTVALAGCSSQQNYTPAEKSPTIFSPTIGKDGTLRVGVNTANAPLAGQPSGSSKIVGIDVDIAAALADTLGLKLEIVDVGTDPEGALSSGKIDIVMGIDKSDTGVIFWKSDTYLPTAVALFAASPSTAVPTKGSNPKIAAQVSSKSAWAVTNEYGDDAFTPTTDLKSAFSALDSGQVQFVAADAVIGTYAAHSAGGTTSVVALIQQPGGYCVGVSDSKADLKQAISEALSTITSNGVVPVIEMKWLGTSLDFTKTPLTASAQTTTQKTASGTSTGSLSTASAKTN